MRIAVNGTTLAVQDTGAGLLALVFLHYFGGAGRAWAGVAQRLAGRYRCIVPDLRGFGDSAAPAGGYTVADYADDIAALIATLGLDRYRLVGHSMGGKIALALAARRPAGLESLLLIAPSPPSPEPMAPAERARLLAGYGDRATAETTIRNITVPNLRAVLRDQAVADNLRSARVAWAAWLETGSRADLTAHMGQITVPVQVLAGAHDPVFPVDLLQREVADRIAGATLRVLPAHGHLLPLTAPASVAAAIGAGLTG